MEVLSKLYVRMREFHKKLRKGQTMTEYALIIAAVAVVVFVTYQVMGQDIIHLITWEVDNDLAVAS
jgi:Flp pilus assembly pilin Flp